MLSAATSLAKKLSINAKLLFRRPTSQEYESENNFKKEDAKYESQKNFMYTNAGFASKLFYGYISPLMQTGARRSLGNQDVPELPPEVMKPDAVAEKFWKRLRRNTPPGKQKADGGDEGTSFSTSSSYSSSWSLRNLGKQYFMVKTLCQVGIKEYLVAAIPKLLGDLFILLSSLILREILLYVEGKNTISNSFWYALLMCFLYFADKSLQCICDEGYWFLLRVIEEKVTTSITYAIYSKSLLLSSTARQTYSTGECINLMSSDVDRFREILFDMHMFWMNTLRIVLSLGMLAWLMGFLPMLASALVILIILPINFIFHRKTEGHVKEMDEARDTRVKTIQEIVSSIRVLKLFAWEDHFLTKAEQHRTRETSLNQNAQRLNIYSSIFWNCSHVFMTFAALFTYSYVLGQAITISIAFSALSIISALTWSLFIIPRSMITLVAVKSSIQRLQAFFCQEELTTVNTNSLSDSVVEMNDASFSWSADEKSTHLSCISLKIKHGSFVAVVGATGHGKTSLISAMLGEMRQVSGELSVNATLIAYVPQKPWILSATVRDNILFGNQYDKQRYEEVIEACCLTEDLRQMPAGDLSEIGEKGINLSGGQKARVNLARALYTMNADLTIMDDVLAAVDSVVGKHLLEKALIKYLHGRTRILVTHQLHLLPHVDYIVVMRNGTIAEQGTYESLYSRNGVLRQLIMEHTVPNSEQVASASTLVDEPTREHAEKQEELTQANGSFIEHDQKEEGEIGWHCVKDYFTIYSFRLIAVITIIIFARNSIDVFSEMWLGYWGSDTELKNHSAAIYTLVYGAAGILKAMITFVVSFMATIFFVNTGRAYHSRMLKSIIHAKASFFDKTPSGRIVSRFSSDMYQIDRDLPYHVIEGIVSWCSVMQSVLFIVYMTPAFLLYFIPLLIYYIYLQNYFKRTNVDLSRLHSMTNSPIFSQFSETLDGISTIRAYGAQSRFKKTNIALQTEKAKIGFLQNVADRWLIIRIEIAGMAIVGVTTLIGLLTVTNFSTFTSSWGDSNNTKAALIGVLLNRCVIIPYEVDWGIRMFSDAQANFSGVERIIQMSNLEPEKYNGEDEVAEEDRTLYDSLDAEWPSKGTIHIKDVVMRYRENLDPVLNGISITINDCEKVGIVGRTGAGKSSLLSILFRLREYEAGQIQIDGKDIAKMSLKKLRNGLSIIPQEPVLITGKLRESLDPSGDYDDFEIWKALDHVSMKEQIARLPEQLDTMIAENASNFSAGEKQLLCMARAILRSRKILVIDEATANVDLQTDALIQKTIRQEFKHCTVLTIAHRLDTIMDYDKIVVMDKGRIVEFDAPATLIKQPNSLFLSMVEMTGAKTASHLKQLATRTQNLVTKK